MHHKDATALYFLAGALLGASDTRDIIAVAQRSWNDSPVYRGVVDALQELPTSDTETLIEGLLASPKGAPLGEAMRDLRELRD